MSEHEHAELEATLRRLGVREIEERMEFSPVLMADGQGLAADDPDDGGAMRVCCACKIPKPSLPPPDLFD